MPKPIVATVDLYSIRFWVTKGTRHTEFVLLSALEEKAPDARTRKDGSWPDYGTLVLAIIPDTGDLKGETFTYSTGCSFTESREYAKGKDATGQRKFVVTMKDEPTVAQLERLYLGQKQGFKMELTPVPKTKELDLDNPPEAGEPTVTTEAIHDPALNSPEAAELHKAVNTMGKGKRGRKAKVKE